MAVNDKDRAVVFEIKENIGVLAVNTSGWTKELNMVAWNGGNPKYDLRDWDEEHEHMSKGITLHPDEMRKVVELLEGRDL
ncbi:MAG: PC4/YdbC family ssDNA-binding protein [Anaerovoracaceae bacterium]